MKWPTTPMNLSQIRYNVSFQPEYWMPAFAGMTQCLSEGLTNFQTGIGEMSKAHFLKNLASQLTEALPGHVGALKKDFEKNCQSILTRAFAKFDLVTREEFETQSKVLGRTRKKLEELESQLKSLDELLKTKHHK